MERVVPWSALCALIEPFYPKPGNGRPPVGVERMLRIYFLRQWFNLSDPAVEEGLYDSLAMRRFVDIDLGREPVPDETTVCRFRHLLEAHDLGQQLFDEVQRHLAAKGLRWQLARLSMRQSSVRRLRPRMRRRHATPEMHQTKKGNQWYFGMKAHLGVDTRTKLIHAMVATPANVADSTVLPELLHGHETRAGGITALHHAVKEPVYGLAMIRRD
jgi:IS5 family transposase